MRKTLTLSLCAFAMASSAPALAQDAYIGQIKAFGFEYCPRGWTMASGQILAISDYPVLFALYERTYGGNGVNTFALPDLNGRFAVGAGPGPGLTSWPLGSQYGKPRTSLDVNQMPPHSHGFNATTERANTPDPNNGLLGSFATVAAYAAAGSSDQVMHPDSIAPAGGGEPLSIQDPFLTITYCVNLNGLFPPKPPTQ